MLTTACGDVLEERLGRLGEEQVGLNRSHLRGHLATRMCALYCFTTSSLHPSLGTPAACGAIDAH